MDLPIIINIPPTELEIATPGATYVVAIHSHLVEIKPAAPAPAQNPWAYPVGSDKFPTMQWYAYQRHTWDPVDNPEGHTGVDLNAWQAPFGDVDRGEPIWAVADGTVSSLGHSESWLAVVVIQHHHNGTPIWFRYAHLDPDSLDLDIGDRVLAAQKLGILGNYTGGDTGDHLHLDAARDPFQWHQYRDPDIAWLDPIPILTSPLDPQVIAAMLEKG